jgi:hypothetical protein
MKQLKFGVCEICSEVEAHVLHHNSGILPSGRQGHTFVAKHKDVAEASPALYAERYAFRLEPYYSRHVNAMTAEALHSKGAIAAELAFRDKQIARLREALSSARGEITRLGTDGGGFSCTVIDDIDAALGGVKGAGP